MPSAAPALARELGVRDLALFNIAAVLSIRWLSTAAHIGPGSLTLWAGAALLFFIPLALAVNGLHDRYPEEGGIYAWTGHAFGEWHGFLCGWCYWTSNLFYFPNLLLSGIGISLFTLGPRYSAQADNPWLVTSFSLTVLWLALITNLVGLRVGKWTQNLGASSTCLAGLILLILGAAAYLKHGSATPIHIAPQWNWNTINFWPQIAFAFGGLELGAILSGEIRDPLRTVRRAAWISSAVIATFYMLGTLSILALIPPQDVNIITGLAQAGEAAGSRFGLLWIAPLLAALVAFGIMGQFGAWIGGSARLASTIGVDRYLPASFARIHPRWRTPHIALLSQGVACTVFLLLMQAGESLRTGYQLLVDMTVISYFIPFLYLFAAAWKHGQRLPAAAGFLVTTAGIAFSFVPPGGVSSVAVFELKLLGSCVILIGGAWLLYASRRSASTAASAIRSL